MERERYLQWENHPVSPRHLFLDRVNHLLEAPLSSLATDRVHTETRHLIFLCLRLNEGSLSLNHSIIMFQSKQYVVVSSWYKTNNLSHKDNQTEIIIMILIIKCEALFFLEMPI